MKANSPGAVIEIVRRTNLATLLPATIAAGHDDLAAVALDPAVLRRTAVLLQRKGAYRSAAARAFAELALAQGAGKSSRESMARATRKRTSGGLPVMLNGGQSRRARAPDAPLERNARVTLNRREATVRQLYPRIATAATSGRSIVFPTSDVIGSCSTA